MREPPDFLDESAKEAVHAAKNAAQAVEIARQTQLESITDTAAHTAADLAARKIAEKIVEKKELQEMMNAAVMKGFSFEDTDERRRFIDVTKEKLICQSIVNISVRLNTIEGNITWAVRIVIGAVIMALLGMIFIKG